MTYFPSTAGDNHAQHELLLAVDAAVVAASSQSQTPQPTFHRQCYMLRLCQGTSQVHWLYYSGLAHAGTPAEGPW